MSVSLDATVDRRAGVALVTARVSNPAPVARRVRLENRLDGPVLPPRCRGVPEPGWSDGGFEGVVPAEGTLGLGYACPVGGGASVDPPLELADVGAPGATTDSPAERARRDLAPARPPRDAVPLPADPGGDPTTRPGPEPKRASGSTTPAASDLDAEAGAGGAAGGTPDPDAADATVGPDAAGGAGSDADTDGSEPAGSDGPDPDEPDPSAASPDPVDAYLDAVERRVALGERLTDASVADATAALSAADPEAVRVGDLPRTLAADADALEALADRAERLAERARATDVPVAALGGLA